MRGLRRDERGASMVEAPFAIVVLIFLAMGAVAFAQIMLSYQHLTGASRAAARYAAKNDYDPTKTPASSSRRPTSADVTTFAFADASPLGGPDLTVGVTNQGGTDNASGAIGQRVNVSVSANVDDGAYQLVAGLVNGLGSLFGKPQVLPYPYRIHSEAVALYE